jgi:hypothetical protein
MGVEPVIMASRLPDTTDQCFQRGLVLDVAQIVETVAA